MRGNVIERGETALVALDGDDATRPQGEKRPRQTARPGADFDDGCFIEGRGGAGDAGGEIEVEKEILAERFLRIESMLGDDFAQRRKIV
jgi:hypothetical protein